MAGEIYFILGFVMKKRFALVLCGLIGLFWAGSVSAAISSDTLIKYAITSDNVVTDFSVFGANGETISMIDLSGQDNAWQTAIVGTESVSLTQGETYYLQWTVLNTPKSGQNDGYFNNPMAFVGQFSVNGIDYYLSSGSEMWRVDSGAPTVFGSLADTSRWSAGISSLLNGISGNAMWIGLGDPANFGSGFSRMTVTASFMAPVPIPGAAFLLGSALLGLVGFRRARAL